MSETKHTQGPWEVSDTSVCLDGPLSSWDRTICALGHYDSDGRTCYPNAEANGLLIAAAPDMLAALKAVVKELTYSTGEVFEPSDEEIVKLAKAAIAKAEGGAK